MNSRIDRTMQKMIEIFYPAMPISLIASVLYLFHRLPSSWTPALGALNIVLIIINLGLKLRKSQDAKISQAERGPDL